MTDIGESIVGAHLRHVLRCDLVTYNERTPGQGEIDVIGIRGTPAPEVWVCEVSTHLDGLLYGDRAATTRAAIEKKVDRGAEYAARVLPDHAAHVQVWAPRVSPGQRAWMEEYAARRARPGLDVAFVVNELYTAALQTMIDRARETTATPGEPAYRMLQILTHVAGGLDLGPLGQ